MLHTVLLHVPERSSTAAIVLRGVLLALLFIWGCKFILSAPQTNAAGNSFMHLVNLPFHEAGHIFFGLLGRFIGSLGGTLGQLLMPCICMAVLLLKQRDPFGASVALWWFGQNFIDIAPYINDARAGVLPLLGGNTGDSSPYGFHDWQFILTELKLLKYDHGLASASQTIGALIMLASTFWGSAELRKQYQKRS